MNVIEEQVYDIVMPLQGQYLPQNWHYPMYGAICKHLDSRFAPGVSFRYMGGFVVSTNRLHILPDAKMVFRTPASYAPTIMSLMGNRLDIDNYPVRFGSAKVYNLKPSTNLYSRMVTYSGGMDPIIFTQQCLDHLARMGVQAKVNLPCRFDGNLAKKILVIKGAKVVGYQLTLENLSDQDSLLLQKVGLGGRRHMGCGVFTPCR
jgi:CRISPR-associated endonuclease/helicase Cas3